MEAKTWENNVDVAGHSGTGQGPEAVKTEKPLSVRKDRSPEESKGNFTAAWVPTPFPITIPKIIFVIKYYHHSQHPICLPCSAQYFSITTSLLFHCLSPPTRIKTAWLS